MNWVQCCTFTLRKTFFFPKKVFYLPVTHKIFATRHWFSEGIDDWSQLGMEKGQHSSTSTVLSFAPNRYQWLGLIRLFGFRCSCKDRHEESFLAERVGAHLHPRNKLKVSGTFRNRVTCLSIPPWVHGEADILKMVPWLQQPVWGLDHHFINAIAFLRSGLTSKLTVRRQSTSVYHFAFMPLSLMDKITTFSGLSTPEDRN